MKSLEEQLVVAIQIAGNAHYNQFDKGGQPYILHPLRVMMKMDTIEEKIVAILHDVIEDSELTFSELLSYGFDKSVHDALDLLTKTREQDYESYITYVALSALATKVKIADLEDNMNMFRLKEMSEADLFRPKKYHDAWRRLKNDQTRRSR